MLWAALRPICFSISRGIAIMLSQPHQQELAISSTDHGVDLMAVSGVIIESRLEGLRDLQSESGIAACLSPVLVLIC